MPTLLEVWGEPIRLGQTGHGPNRCIPICMLTPSIVLFTKCNKSLQEQRNLRLPTLAAKIGSGATIGNVLDQNWQQRT